MQSIKRQYSHIGNTNARNTNTGNTKRREFTTEQSQQSLQQLLQQPLIITPVKPRSSLLFSQPNTPHKLKRQKAIIVEHHDIQLLKNLIMVLVKNLNLSNKTNLNNWLKIYKEKANNNSSNPEKEISIPIFSIKGLKLNSFKVSNKSNTIFSGTYANVFTNIKTKNGYPLDIVIKRFKKKTNNNRIDTTILDELYGALVTLYIERNLGKEDQHFFNRILGLYLVKKFMKISTLQLVLEKCNGGDIITYFGNLNLTKLDINAKCNIFHKLCYDGLVILFLLIQLELVHFDIKIDNILVNNNQFKLSDFSTVRPYKTPIQSKFGTNSYISPLFLLELKNNNATAKYLYDCYSMALTFFNIFLFLFPSNIRTLQYFPFINDESTFESKIDIWSSEIKYNLQVNILESSLMDSFQKILQIPGLTEDNKTNLEKDIEIMKVLFFSNNPFPAELQNMETETIEEIKTYLGIHVNQPHPSTN